MAETIEQMVAEGTEPTTAGGVVDAIPRLFRDEAITLVERYASRSRADLMKALQGSNAMLQLLRSMVEASETVACIDKQVKLNVAALASPSSAEGRE
jgi:hypothetical protein